MNDGFVILMHNRACSRGSRSSSGSRAALEITLPRALIGASRAHALVLSDVLRYHVHTHRTERCVWTKERKRMSSEAKHSEEELGVVITGGAGSIAYALIPLIGNGTVFGARKVSLRLLDIESAAKALSGVEMEIQDSGFPCLSSVVATTDVQQAFLDVDVAILLGGFPRKEGMTRADLISRNVPIMRQHGEGLERFAKRSVRVVVVANPANTNCLVAMRFAPSIPARSFTCLTRLDHERLRGMLEAKLRNLGRHTHVGVKDVCIFGNHSSTQVPWTGAATDPTLTPVSDAIADPQWLSTTLVAEVRERGRRVIETRGLSSAMSAAAALQKHLHDWLVDDGIPQGELFSMGVLSNDNTYGVPSGLVFSFPCVRASVQCGYRVVNLALSHDALTALRQSTDELIAERTEAESVVGDLSVHTSRL